MPTADAILRKKLEKAKKGSPSTPDATLAKGRKKARARSGSKAPRKISKMLKGMKKMAKGYTRSKARAKKKGPSNTARAAAYKARNPGKQGYRENQQKRDMGQTRTGKYYRGEMAKMSKKNLMEALTKAMSSKPK